MMSCLTQLIDQLTVILLVAATSDSSAGPPINRDLTYRDRVTFVSAVVTESRRHSMDPVFVLAVAWVESGMRPRLAVRRTRDYGILQVHWQPLGRGETWLVGITRPDELLDIKVGVRAGVAELAHWRRRCRSSRTRWWQCYRHGYRAHPTAWYADKVATRWRWLRYRVRRVLRAWSRPGEV